MLRWKGLEGRVRQKVPLRLHTSFKIGGPVSFFIEPKDSAGLKAVLVLLKNERIPFYVIGSGSNILVSDRGLKAAVIRLSSQTFKKIKISGNLLEAGAGAYLKDILIFCRRKKLSGAEFLAGIPGTIGGALIMNAGIPERCIGDVTEEITAMDYSGRVKVFPSRRIKFGYRQISLSKCIILAAKLRLKRDSSFRISRKIREYLNRRRKHQDYLHPSAGCIFKNPPGKTTAGKLIDLCGLKGKRRGGALISLRHANFILNIGKAKAEDVLGLMQLARREVKRRFEINLEPEIKIWH